ncbi:MAG: hypothetical protein WKG00_31180 [Polyangiaceae bacterium]
MPRARLLALATFAVLALLAWPQRALAAILPACEEAPAATMLPAPAPQPLPQSDCERAADEGDDDTALAFGAPICDAHGASALAPPRIFPVEDSRIEAAPGTCARGSGDADAAVSPQQQERPASASFALPHAALPELPALGASRVWVEARPLPKAEAHARDGLRARIYHPPR